jgi:hypothetical protein
MMVVEEPTIVVAVAQRSLKIGEIHAYPIVNEWADAVGFSTSEGLALVVDPLSGSPLQSKIL